MIENRKHSPGGRQNRKQKETGSLERRGPRPTGPAAEDPPPLGPEAAVRADADEEGREPHCGPAGAHSPRVCAWVPVLAPPAPPCLASA